MKKRTLALLLAACMLLALTACGSASEAETTSAETETEGSVEASTEAAEDAVESEAAEVSEESDEESADAGDAVSGEASEETGDASEASPEETAQAASAISYPISDGSLTFTMTAVYNPNATAVFGDGDYSECVTYADLAEATGVNLEFTMLAETSYSTNLDLMVASENTPDLFSRSIGSYDSKLTAAIEDEVVIDVSGMLEENAPDLYALMQQYPEWADQITNTDGTICKIAGWTLSYTGSGCFIRQDWLDELNLEAPSTLEELTDVLIAFQQAYGTSATMLLDSELGSPLDDCFNVSFMGFKSLEFQQDAENSGNLICTFATEAYIDYLATLNEYYEMGLISADFVTTSKDNNNIETLYINGDSGVWSDDAKYTYNNAITARDADADWTATPFVLDKSDYHLYESSDSGGVSMTQVYISANCPEPELALQFLNYGYTEEGSMLIQAGKEDLTYTLDEDGSFAFTDLIINNPDGLTSTQAGVLYYCDSFLPSVQQEVVMRANYTDEVLAAYDLYTDSYGGDDSMLVPQSFKLSAENETEVTQLSGDVLTLISSSSYKVVLGDESIEEYRAMLEDAMSMGLERITELYQMDYDVYLAEQ